MKERVKSRSGSKASFKDQPHYSKAKTKREKVDLDKFEDLEDDDKGLLTKRKKSAKINKLAKKVEQSLEDLENGEEVLPSVFKDAFQQMKKTLNSDTSISLDLAAMDFARSAYIMLTDLVPIAEEAYRKTQKESAAYALTALLNQIREVQNDLRITEDVESKALILKGVVDTTMLGIAQLIVQERYELNTRLDAVTNDSRIRKAMRAETNAMMKSLAKGLEDHGQLLAERVRAYLMGMPNYMNPNAPVEDSKKKRKKGRKRIEE